MVDTTRTARLPQARATVPHPYAVQVDRVPVTFTSTTGEKLTGATYLRPVGPDGSRPESLLQRVSDPETRFLPVDLGDRVDLIHVGLVAAITRPGRTSEVDRLFESGCNRAPADLHLVGGGRLRGELLYVLPEGRRRVLDLLNEPTQRFLLLWDAAETHYVNRDAVLRVGC